MTAIILMGEPNEPTAAELDSFVELLQSILERPEEQLELAS